MKNAKKGISKIKLVVFFLVASLTIWLVLSLEPGDKKDINDNQVFDDSSEPKPSTEDLGSEPCSIIKHNDLDIKIKNLLSTLFFSSNLNIIEQHSVGFSSINYLMGNNIILGNSLDRVSIEYTCDMINKCFNSKIVIKKHLKFVEILLKNPNTEKIVIEMPKLVVNDFNGSSFILKADKIKQNLNSKNFIFENAILLINNTKIRSKIIKAIPDGKTSYILKGRTNESIKYLDKILLPNTSFDIRASQNGYSLTFNYEKVII